MSYCRAEGLERASITFPYDAPLLLKIIEIKVLGLCGGFHSIHFLDFEDLQLRAYNGSFSDEALLLWLE